MTSVSYNSEVISTLSRLNALWQKICGPNGQGVSFENLLTHVQESYPESVWDEALLTDILLVGLREGRYKEFPENTFYLNTAMVQVNPRNQIYLPYSTAICTLPPCTRARTIFY